MKSIDQLRIGLCSDHAGYEMKKIILEHLQSRNPLEVRDFGCFSAESCDYPDYAHPMAIAVEKGEVDYGVSVCGTGNGISITLNKHQGIRAALCWNEATADLARRHNDANILSMPGRFITNETALKMVDIFFSTDFEGGRHQKRIDKIPVECC